MRKSLFPGALVTVLLSGVILFSGCERSSATNAAAEPTVTVYLSPTCGCCSLWAEYMEAEGFDVNQIEVPDIGAVRARLGVPPMLGSCHTAVVGDYLVEGHVPSDDVRKLLADRPEGIGISVPGMPIGSPGMEVPGRAPQAYETYLFTADGRATVFARH